MGIMENTIIFFCNYTSPYGGNFLPSMLFLCESLRNRQCNVVLVFPEKARTREWFNRVLSSGYDFETIDFKKSILEHIKEIDVIVKKYNGKIIHSHFCNIGAFELYSYIRKDVRVFIHAHSDFRSGNKTLKNELKFTLYYKVMSKRITFLCVSKEIASLHPRNSIYIPNALAISRMNNSVEDSTLFKQSMNISSDSVLCELYGWSPYVKGVDIAVEAVKLANLNSDVPIVLGIVCGLRYNVNTMKAYIQKNTSCNGDEPFLRFFEPREDVYTFHNAADILLSTSRSEGFSYSILEMLTIGKRCVCSDIAGTQWSLKYSSVISFPSENIEKCASAIVRSISLPKVDIDTMNQSRSDYSIDSWSKAIMDAYGG